MIPVFDFVSLNEILIKLVCFDFIFAETESVDSSPPVAERTQFLTASFEK